MAADEAAEFPLTIAGLADAQGTIWNIGNADFDAALRRLQTLSTEMQRLLDAPRSDQEPRLPFVLGTCPACLASGSSASRSARAHAL